VGGTIDIGAFEAQIGPAVAVRVAAPASAGAGTPFDVTVTAQDAYGHLAADYTGTVTFASADPYGATLPADYTFTAEDGGVHTFPSGATLYTAGTWDVTVSDSSNGLTGTASVVVTPAAAASLSLGAPAAVVSGQPFVVTVTARDPYGNIATGAGGPDTSYTGTVYFLSTDPTAQFQDPAGNPITTYTFTTDDQGQASFFVVLDTPGVQALGVADPGNRFSDIVFLTVTDSGPHGPNGYSGSPLLVPYAPPGFAPAAPSRTPGPAAPPAPGQQSRPEVGAVDRYFAAPGAKDPRWVWSPWGHPGPGTGDPRGLGLLGTGSNKLVPDRQVEPCGPSAAA
jgi:hypothetical protein